MPHRHHFRTLAAFLAAIPIYLIYNDSSQINESLTKCVSAGRGENRS